MDVRILCGIIPCFLQDLHTHVSCFMVATGERCFITLIPYHTLPYFRVWHAKLRLKAMKREFRQEFKPFPLTAPALCDSPFLLKPFYPR